MAAHAPEATLRSTLLPALPIFLAACGPVGGEKLNTNVDADGDGIFAVNDCNDQDGMIGKSAVYYYDGDRDGHGTPAVFETFCEAPEGYVKVGDDCDDENPLVYPGFGELCDGIDNDCDGEIDPGMVMLPWYADTDADGYGDVASTVQDCTAPEGFVEDAADCADADAAVNPGATEVCNELDDDCDTLVDADDDSLDGSSALVVYTDGDGDGYGDPASAAVVCEAGAWQIADGQDCDDSTAAVSPAAVELCNGEDDDCDGEIDIDATDASIWYADSDGDGFGNATTSAMACDAPADHVADDSDCDDSTAAVNPFATEVCDTIDNNCDGVIDTDAADVGTWYADADGDGYGDASISSVGCAAPANAVADATDCDDTDATVFPGAAEVCGGSDLDCDLSAPEMCSSCAEALADGYTTDGLTFIDVDGFGGAVPELQVWCDQTTDGGGWTLVQRTVWDWADTSLLLTDYADWYGVHQGDATTGEVFRLAGVAWSVVGAGGEMLGVHHARDSSSLGDCDPLYYTGSGGTVTVTSTAADLGAFSSTVSLTNAAELSTTDAGPSTDCVNDYGGVPWFYSTCCSPCPSFMSSYWSDEAHPMIGYADSSADLNGRTAADTCPSGAALPNESAGGYEGINVMEFYLR